MTEWAEFTLLDQPVVVDVSSVVAVETIVDSYTRWGIHPKLTSRSVCYLVMNARRPDDPRGPAGTAIRVAVDGTVSEILTKLPGGKVRIQ